MKSSLKKAKRGAYHPIEHYALDRKFAPQVAALVRTHGWAATASAHRRGSSLQVSGTGGWCWVLYVEGYMTEVIIQAALQCWSSDNGKQREEGNEGCLRLIDLSLLAYRMSFGPSPAEDEARTEAVYRMGGIEALRTIVRLPGIIESRLARAADGAT